MKIQLLSLAFGLLSSIGFAQNDITLEDLWINYSYQPDYVRGFNSMNDGLHYTILNNKAIEKMDYATQKKVGEMASFEDLGIQYSSYHFNANESQILLTSERKSIYRHSYEANFYVYDLANKQLEELAEGKQMLATFSPNSQHIAYVFENNLYIKDQNTKTIAQITTDGKKNEIINGAPDWVYEEEFGFNKAFEWNADGSKLAYYKFDESEVEVFGMDMFQQHLYPQSYRFKYPKAGEKNATVELWIYDLETNRSTKIEQNIDTEFYIPRLKWTKNPAVLSFQRLNRHQNQLDFILYDCETKTSRTLFVETDEAYVDIHDDLTFLDNGKHLIWSSEKSGFKHIYLVDLKSSKEKQITSGNWEVTQFYGYNEGDKKLYFQSNEHSPLQRSIYSIGLNGKGKKELTKAKGTHRAQFSSSFDYFVDTYSSANTPNVVSIRTKTGKEIKVLAKSDRLNAKLDKLNLKPKEFISFETETGTNLNGYLIKPKDFDANKTYPVFMYLYGGPGSQQVLDSW
ncbi:MAG: S9 family peptidase, partial [Flavobacteriales bacterium]